MPQICKSCSTPNLPDDAKFCPSCGSPLAGAAKPAAPAPVASPVVAPKPVVSHAPPPENATVLDGPRAIAGRFITTGPAVEGPTGSSVPAQDMQGGAAVRVLVVAEAVLPSSALAERALREWKQLAKVASTKIVRVVDQGRLDDGKVYVASHAPRGSSLEELVAQEGPLAIERARKVLAQIGEALTEAQKVGVIHRDVAPRNVYVDGEDVTVAEFGLAEAVSDKVYGSPAYLSPEQAEGKPVDQRSNIYSLGAVLYYMLTGRAPFSGDPQSLLAQHISATPAAPSTLRPGLPAELDRIVLKALEKSGGRRHLTLRQLITEVESVPAGASVVRSAELGVAATLQPPAAANLPAMGATILGMAAPEVAKINAAKPEAAKNDVGTETGKNDTAQTGPSPSMPEPAQARTVMAEAPKLPTPALVVAAAPVAAAPVAAPAPAAAAMKPLTAKAPAPAAKKGGFRETAWFKKGEIEEELAKAQAETGTEDPLAPSGATGQRAAVDESGADLSASDAKRLSLKTGATQMMQAVKPGASGSASALPGDRMDEAEMLAEIDQSKRWFMIAGGIVLIGIIILVIVLMKSKSGDTAPAHGKADTPTPPTAAAPTTNAPSAAAPAAAVPSPGAAPAAAKTSAAAPAAPAPSTPAAATATDGASLLAEAELATTAHSWVVAVDALVRAAHAGADKAKVGELASTLGKTFAAAAAKAKKKKDRAAEMENNALLAKVRPLTPAAAPGKKVARATVRRR